MAITNQVQKGYGLNNALQSLAPRPVPALINPASTSNKVPGTIWVNLTNSEIFIAGQTAAGSTTWVNVGGGSGSFMTLSVSGTSSLVGTVTTGGTLNVGSNLVVTSTILAGTNISTTNGNLSLGTAGNKINIATGTNASIGQSAAMTAGTITISTTAVTASSIIFLTYANVGGTQGSLSVGTITAGTSFVINSSSATDTSKVNWLIIN